MKAAALVVGGAVGAAAREGLVEAVAGRRGVARRAGQVVGRAAGAGPGGFRLSGGCQGRDPEAGTDRGPEQGVIAFTARVSWEK
jgi:hypothetical protein